jgi:hypothetical protein
MHDATLYAASPGSAVSRAARRHSFSPSTVSGILRGDQSARTSRLVRGNRLRGASPGHKTRFTIETVADAASSRCFPRVSRAIAFQFSLIRRNGSGEDASFYSKSERHAPSSAIPRTIWNDRSTFSIRVTPRQIARSSRRDPSPRPEERKTRRFAGFINYSREELVPPSICTARF